VTQNTYSGFDSKDEIVNTKKFKNKLISLHTAEQRRTIVKIPLYHTFDISYITNYKPLT
jgi:hypothetical protein